MKYAQQITGEDMSPEIYVKLKKSLDKSQMPPELYLHHFQNIQKIYQGMKMAGTNSQEKFGKLVETFIDLLNTYQQIK